MEKTLPCDVLLTLWPSVNQMVTATVEPVKFAGKLMRAVIGSPGAERTYGLDEIICKLSMGAATSVMYGERSKANGSSKCTRSVEMSRSSAGSHRGASFTAATTNVARASENAPVGSFPPNDTVWVPYQSGGRARTDTSPCGVISKVRFVLPR